MRSGKKKQSSVTSGFGRKKNNQVSSENFKNRDCGQYGGRNIKIWCLYNSWGSLRLSIFFSMSGPHM